ncbi:PAS domain S-box protein, partial [Streptomyces sp. SID4919]|uniref:PAS domain S-box protein n=1 Tax=Streptomyces sp. SID4919 TaxID=2690270 RepID=UPI0008239F46
QTVANGVVSGLGYELAAVNLVRPDGDLVVAAFAGDASAVALMTGRVGPRAAWDRRLGMGERWGSLIFIPHSEGWVLDEDDVPQWYTDGPEPRFEDEWHPSDRLFAPLWANATLPGELIGVISVDRPRNSRRPGTWQREALQVYAAHAAVAISNARLRANMQRALVRLEREQQALRASEESFRQAFEYAPSGMAIAEMGGDQSGRMMRTNDALCRILGRPASALRRYSFADLVHAEDIGTLLRTSAEGGRAELRLARRDNTYVWVSLRNSVVADAADGPRFLLTHVEDIEERKRRERQLTHDGVTGLLNAEGVRWRLSSLLCGVSPALAMVPAAERPTDPLHGGQPSAPDWLTVGGHTHVTTPSYEHDCSRGLAVLLCQLRGSGWMGNRMGGRTSDAVLMEIARRLSSTVRTGDTVARLSDDEFVVLAEHLDVQQAQDLSSALRESLGSAVRAGDGPARAKAEVILRWASCGMTAEELLRPTNRHRRSTS